MCQLTVKIKRNQFSIDLAKDLNYIPNRDIDPKESVLNLFNAITIAGKTLIEIIGDAQYVYDEIKNIVKVYKCKISNKVNPNKPFVNFLTKKQVDFTDFTSFIMYTAVECEEDMGFLDAKSYHEGNFDNCQYATNEDALETLEKLIGMDYDTMEKEFKTIRWEDNENTAIVSFKNDKKKYAILRM